MPNTEWYWLENHRRTFSDMPRGPEKDYKNFKEFVPYYESGKYDLALLHLDQQCMHTELWEMGKGSLFRELNEVITDIPKVVIIHGTPYYPEEHPCDITKDNYQQLGFTKKQIGMSSELINRLKLVTKDCAYVIFNSHRAREQWGFEDVENSKTVWHGLDKNDWYDLSKEPRVVTMISPGGFPKYYDRTFLKAVREELWDRNIIHCHITVDVKFRNWEEYRQFLGRSLIYFNPTRESCMPRARTEAMLSGCCVITTLNQDSEKFIEDGVNGYRAIRNPKYIADLIEGLFKNYKQTVAIGQKGKETAIKLFDKDRYENEMLEIFNKVIK